MHLKVLVCDVLSYILFWMIDFYCVFILVNYYSSDALLSAFQLKLLVDYSAGQLTFFPAVVAGLLSWSEAPKR